VGRITPSDRAIAAALVALPGIRAVSLGGSRAVGLTDGASDTDLYAWYRGALTTADRRRAALADLADDDVRSFEVFGPEDHWHVDGRLVEVVYLDLDEIERQTARARTEGLAGEVCATAFLHTAYAGMLVDDPYGDLTRLQSDLATYPEATRDRQFAELPVMADEFASQLRTAQTREDWPMVVRRRAGLLDVTVSLVLALNRRYHPGEKRLLVHVGQCAVQPDRLVQRLSSACLADPDDRDLADRFVGLIAEVCALYR
jgi:predicted nucleotidyltransferase